MEVNPSIYTKTEIATAAIQLCQQATEFFRSIQEEDFFKQTGKKWSAAEQIVHLVLATRPVALGMKLPKFSLRIWGTNRQHSNTYLELTARYQQQLAQGAKAAKLFSPNNNTNHKKTQTQIVKDWEKTTTQLLSSMESWTNADLDNYQMPHPLLGKLSIREMLFFTLYHIQYHTNSIAKLLY